MENRGFNQIKNFFAASYSKKSCIILEKKNFCVVPVSQKSNMASVPFVGTLESDDDVDQLDNESDSEEEPEKVYRH